MNSAPSTFRFHVTIVLYNSARYIRECLAAVLAQSLPPCKITVLDNASADGGDDLVANEFPEVHLIRSDCNYGFAGGHNRAAASFTGYDALLLLNPDAVLKADALERLAASLATHPRVGVLGAKALEADGRTIQHVGIRIKGNALTGPVGEGEPDTGQYRGLLPSPSVLGAAMAIRKETWNALGGLDEDFWPGYFEETDFCCRARRAGWQVAVNCDAEYLHLHGTEDRVRDQAFLQMYFTNRARYMKKNYRLWEWAFRYLPAEIRWLTYWGSKGYRRLAVRSLWQVLTGHAPAGKRP